MKEKTEATKPQETFNLLDEPWILCQTTNGRQQVSIRQVFDGSTSVLKVVGDSPTQDYAVLRVLLAIFWRAHQIDLAPTLSSRGSRGAFDWADWFEDRLEAARDYEPDHVVLNYLDTVADRFDLLHPTQPFMQVADLHTAAGNTSDVSRIIPEAEHDYFTMRTGVGRAHLELPEASRWLIHTQAYDYSGIKSGAVGDSRVKGGKGYPIGTGWTGMTGGTVVRGENLSETLVLNTTPGVLHNEGANDLPVWERPLDTASQRSVEPPTPTGPIDLATWQARRIKLHVSDGNITSVLVSNGDQIPDAGKNVFGDPMTPYRFSPNQSKKNVLAYYPRPYDAGRTMWRALDALIATQSDAGFTDKNRAPIRPATLSFLAELAEDDVVSGVLDVNIVSMSYGPQSSSVAETTNADIGIPLQILGKTELSEALRQDVRDAAQATAGAATAVGAFAGQLLTAVGGEYEFGVDAADRMYTRLEPEFITWIRGMNTEDAREYVTSWQQTVLDQALDIASELVKGAGPKALIGRLDGGEDGTGGRLINAATLHQSLRRKLTKILPLTATTKDTSQQTPQMSHPRKD